MKRSSLSCLAAASALLISCPGCRGPRPDKAEGKDPPVTPAAGGNPAAPAAAPASAPAATPAAIPDGDWPALSAPEPRTTPDGIAILEVAAPGSDSRGPLRPIHDVWDTLTFAQLQVSDGESVFFALRNRAQHFSDVLVRGGALYAGVLAQLTGVSPHPGGCGAAAGGRLLLSAPSRVEMQQTKPGQYRTHLDPQRVWSIAPEGSMQTLELPPEAGADQTCKAVVDPDGAFAIFTGNLARYDGESFELERGWYPGRTFMTSALGPRYCFEHCNATERKGSAPEAVVLAAALGGCQARYAVYGHWLAGRCINQDRAARVRRAAGDARTLPKPEILTSLPKKAYLADGVYLTRAGDVVFELQLGMQKYVVWPAGKPGLRPVRTLGEDEFLAQTSPIVMLRGLPRDVPPAEVSAVLLGERIAFGSNGSTYGYIAVRRSAHAYAAQLERARAVLPEGELRVAGEAVVQLDCGSYVRSPVGWEGMQINDWYPPTMPALHPEAVLTPERCLALAEVHAVPGEPDLLIATTTGGHLALAWLPPPLPLPKGRDPRSSEPPAPPVAQRPRPGSGWQLMDKALGAVTRIEAIAGVRGRGDLVFPDGSWQAGGGALLEVGGQRLVMSPAGVWTLPPGEDQHRPMAVERTTPRLYAARGTQLLVCDARCRVVSPGASASIVAVVPRSASEVILGFEGGGSAVLTVPEAGAEGIEPHPLERALEAFLERKPRRTP